jgi:glucosamine-phosphate N-acetyltransferase
MSLRLLQAQDYDKGVIELLSQLTSIDKNKISREQFEKYVWQLDTNPNHKQYVYERDGTIIGTGTILCEPKLIHNLGVVGHIEDIVVDANHRNSGIGYTIIERLTQYAATERGCYKVILDCAEKNRAFYEKCGYKLHGIQMAKYFE